MPFFTDLTLAARRLVKQPGFAVAAVVTLGLGLGATTAIYSVVHGIVLDPLPYPTSAQLIRIDHRAPGIGNEGGMGTSEGIYLHYRARSRTLQESAVYQPFDVSFSGDGEPERLYGMLTTASFATTLRVTPHLGRFYTEDAERPDAPGQAVLSHALWQRRFGSERSVIGRTIILNGQPAEVIGVMAADFAFPSRDVELWLPQPLNLVNPAVGAFRLSSIGRLAAGHDVATAQAEFDRLTLELIEAYPSGPARHIVEDAKLAPTVTPLKTWLIGDVERTLWILLATVGFVLLIACANVANLFLVRAESRDRELAVRVALGAGRERLIQHFMAETTLLAVAGGSVAMGFAALGLGLFRRMAPSNLPRLHEVTIDTNVLVFTGFLVVIIALTFGALPMLTRRGSLAETLKESHRTTARRGRFRARQGLIASQTALALVLIVSATLMARSFWRLKQIDTGFTARNVLSFQLGLPQATYRTREDAVAFHQLVLDRIGELPGVETAAATQCLPLCGRWQGFGWYREDRAPDDMSLPPVAATYRVSGDYFSTLGIRLREGRVLERADYEQRTGAAVVNEEAAKRIWPGEDPMGKQLYHRGGNANAPWYTVVGVVANTPIRTLTEDPAPIVYVPLLHTDRTEGPGPWTLDFVVRSSLPAATLADLVRREVWALDATLPVARVRTTEQILREAGSGMAFTMVLLAIAAGMGLLLGAVGIYAVISYVVNRRTAEFGLRLALGAQARNVTGMVLKQSAVVVAAGLIVGVAGALALARVMRSLLFQVSPNDPATYLAVTLLLGGVALAAAYAPARRAARVDPIETLRAE